MIGILGRVTTLTKGYKSGFERETARYLTEKGITFEYEAQSIKFKQDRKYYPDFKIGKEIFIETKGRFKASDRGKHLLIRDQHPEVDIRFVFMNARTKLSKASTTTYGEWATKWGFKWAEGRVPDAWLKEAKTQKQVRKRLTYRKV
jgi:hypothetical protein